MINTQLQDLSFLTPKIDFPEGNFLTGMVKGVTKGAMRREAGEQGGSDEPQGTSDTDPNTSVDEGKGPKGPNMFGRGLEKLFVDPMAMQKFRQEKAVTQQEEQKVTLGELLERDLPSVLEEFKNTSDTPGRLNMLQKYAGLATTPQGMNLLTMMARTTGEIDKAERLTAKGMMSHMRNTEIASLANYGADPDIPSTWPQARKNKYYATRLAPLAEDGLVINADNDKDFDQFGNAIEPNIQQKIAVAKQQLLERKERAGMSLDERALAILPLDQQQTVLAQRGANLGKTFKRSTTLNPDGSVSTVEGYESDAAPDQRAAKVAFDNANNALAAINTIRGVITNKPEAFDSLGAIKGVVQMGGSAINSVTGREVFDQDIRLARKKADDLRGKLVETFRGDVGKMDVREEQRIIGLLSATDFWSNPALALQTLETAEELNAAKGLLNYMRNPGASGGKLPDQFKRSFKKPKIASSLLQQIPLTPEQKKELFSNLEIEPINTADIATLRNNGLINDSDAIDFIVEGSFDDGERSDISKSSFLTLFPTNKYSKEQWTGIINEYQKRRNDRKAK